QYDSGTELYSLRARFYSPAQGRFLSRDPHPYNYRNPFELNRYVYTANNPATYVDPSGRSLAEIGKQISSAVKALQNGRWVAGATGGTFGAAAAAFVSTSMYWTARWGGCGEHLQDWAKSIDSASFVSISTIFGFISGFITGAYGPGAALAVHMVSTGTTFAISALDIMMNGPNLCNVATLIMAYISGSGSSGTNATLPVQVTAISGNGEVVLSLSGVNWIAVQSGFYNGLNLMFSSSAGGRDDSGFTGGSGGSNEPYEPIRRNNWENDPRFDDLATEVGSTDPNQGSTEAQGILEAENQGIIS
ncbi:MAG: RHS repeat-associated core domain-containing protein, partial [Anaerolineae bacterium]|nr:RHS repeat-associated core domain-containing protein [Anaerolineae bacterium]